MIFLSLFIGNESTGTDELLRALFSEGRKSVRMILFNVRLPRTVSGIICGMALSVSGLLLQTALDNPLCSPGVMGINSGAGFLVLISGIMFPYSSGIREIFAFLGAIIATALIYIICKFAGFSKSVLVLTGVAVSSLFSAGSNALITIKPGAVSDKAAFSLGGLSGISWNQILAALPAVVAGLVIVFLESENLNLLCLGDESSAGLGVSPSRMRRMALIVSAILSGAAVSVCGMLGFVGLIVPNLIKRVGNFGFKREFILCSLVASGFLLACDIASRTLFYPYELPVGLVLSFLGAPFFIFILIKRKRSVTL
ncbi:MAG: iron ABC transporter permease [Catonella sp.]|nr:iron ABC transporter permease [Catonella sp.]